jgi:hypothetical protein
VTYLRCLLLGPSAAVCAVALAATLAMSASAQTTYPSPEAAVPRAAGQVVPSASVQTVTGESVDLADLVRDEGALLVFYRGGW